MRFTKIFLLFLLSIFFSACGEIVKEGDRWQALTPPTQDQNPILIEEYTGQKCINCPDAAKLLQEIVERSGVQHIVVAMHNPYSGMTLPELASSETQEYAKYYGHNRSVPGIMLNRSDFNDGIYYYQTRPLWASLIHTKSFDKPNYKLELKADYLQAKKEIKVSVMSELISNDFNRELSLVLWLVEDVKAPQKLPDGWVKNYQHHNVFRGSLNGTWGEDYKIKTPYEKSFPLPDKVKDPKHAKVIAFLSYKSSKRPVYVSSITTLDIK